MYTCLWALQSKPISSLYTFSLHKNLLTWPIILKFLISQDKQMFLISSDSRFFSFYNWLFTLQTDIICPRNAAIEKGLLNKQKEPFSVRRKDFWDANEHYTQKLLSESFQSKLCHEPDGLVFQPECDVGWGVWFVVVNIHINHC